MMKRIIVGIILLLYYASSAISLAASNSKFGEIPDSLKKNADAVIRFHHTEHEIVNPGKLKSKVHYAITVLNKAGQEFANLRVGYDNSTKVKITKVLGYNRYGAESKNINKKKVHDISNHGSYSFFSDYRVKYTSIAFANYPYTLEFEYEIEHDGFIHIDTWAPLGGTGISVEQASVTVLCDNEGAYKAKELNYNFHSSSSTEDSRFTKKWEIKNQKAFTSLPLAPAPFERYPIVILTPTAFEFEGYIGDFSSWQSYGIWVNKLLQDRQLLPEAEVAKIRAMTAPLSTDYEKAKCLYEYMQGKTRYVSIALGIGGFQPMTAQEVSEVGYGDCKALSNYMMALLKAVGIDSYYTEIGSGRQQKIRFSDYASASQTNHAILTLPLQSDTLFLECTSQTMPFGYIGSSSSNRFALMMTTEGGKLIQTPAYKPENNLRSRKALLKVDENGSAVCTSNEFFSCDQYDDNIAGLIRLSPDEQRKTILEELELTEASLNNYAIQENKKRYPSGELELELSSQKYASIMGSRIIFPVNPNFRAYRQLPDDTKRDIDIVRNIGYVDIDSVQIFIPEGYEIEYLPEKIVSDTKFGKYTCKTELVNETELLFVRYLKIIDGHFDKSTYPELLTFYKHISHADHEKVVLKKL